MLCNNIQLRISSIDLHCWILVVIFLLLLSPTSCFSLCVYVLSEFLTLWNDSFGNSSYHSLHTPSAPPTHLIDVETGPAPCPQSLTLTLEHPPSVICNGLYNALALALALALPCLLFPFVVPYPASTPKFSFSIHDRNSDSDSNKQAPPIHDHDHHHHHHHCAPPPPNQPPPCQSTTSPQPVSPHPADARPPRRLPTAHLPTPQALRSPCPCQHTSQPSKQCTPDSRG